MVSPDLSFYTNIYQYPNIFSYLFLSSNLIIIMAKRSSFSTSFINSLRYIEHIQTLEL